MKKAVSYFAVLLCFLGVILLSNWDSARDWYARTSEPNAYAAQVHKDEEFEKAVTTPVATIPLTDVIHEDNAFTAKVGAETYLFTVSERDADCYVWTPDDVRTMLANDPKIISDDPNIRAKAKRPIALERFQADRVSWWEVSQGDASCPLVGNPTIKP